MTEQPTQDEKWMPLSAREIPDLAQQYEMLHDGVPEWLLGPLRVWIGSNISQYGSPAERITGEWVIDLSTSLRMRFPLHIDKIPPDRSLDVIDRILYRGVREAQRSQLERVLSQGGSLWRVTERGLERRVGAELQSAAESVFADTGRYASHLRDAWQKAWSRNPDASGAYQDGVQAVEAAYKPIVSPDNERATLGTIISNVRDKPTKFRVRLQPRDGSNVERIVAMLELLGKSQRRHGTDDKTVPLNVSIEEAQDAVALATILVHLAQQGGFAAAR